jgi:hypothetical protein
LIFPINVGFYLKRNLFTIDTINGKSNYTYANHKEKSEKEGIYNSNHDMLFIYTGFICNYYSPSFFIFSVPKKWWWQ